MNTPTQIDPDHALQSALPRSEKMPDEPALAVVFRLLGGLEILGGIFVGIYLWPKENYGWQPLVYLPAVSWLVAGVIFGCLFLAIAEGLTYLSQISFCCRWSLTLTKADWLARLKV